MVNKLIIAAAGSGKTTYLVKSALEQSENVLITTFTNANEIEIKEKFFEINGYIPANITIQTWYSFILQHGVRSFQSVVLDEKINGMILVNSKSGIKYQGKKGPVYYKEEDYQNHFFTKEMKMYSDKIAKFVCICEKRTNGNVSKRIERIFSKIYIDEIQDMAGYDLEIIRYLMKANCDVVMVGDPRQVTYHTHFDVKYKKYLDGKIEDFIKNECKKIACEVDKMLLRKSFRNNEIICEYSSKLYPEYEKTITGQFDITGHDGIFIIKPKDIREYMDKFKPMQLRENRRVSVDERYPVLNMGESKGKTYDRILIYPTSTMKKWIEDHTSSLKNKTRAQLYVALTRARYSVAIVYDYNNETNIIDVKKYK